jgi:ankyrin repeat protein
MLVEAAKVGDVARVDALVRATPSLAGARLDSGESALMAALYRGHPGVVSALVSAGADLDVFAAAALGRLDALRVAFADPSSVGLYAYDGWTALHLAAFFGSLEATHALLDAGADVNAVSRNSMTNTPLHAATAGKHSAVALLLLGHGASSHAIDAGGYTPLQIAEQNGLAEVVEAITRPTA